MAPKKDTTGAKKKQVIPNNPDLASSEALVKDISGFKQGSLTNYLHKTPTIQSKPGRSVDEDDHARDINIEDDPDSANVNMTISDSVMISEFASPNVSLVANTNEADSETNSTEVTGTPEMTSPTNEVNSTIATHNLTPDMIETIVNRAMIPPMNEIAKSLASLTDIVSRLNGIVGKSFAHVNEVALDGQTLVTKQNDLLKKAIDDKAEDFQSVTDELKKYGILQKTLADTAKQTLKVSQNLASKLLSRENNSGSLSRETNHVPTSNIGCTLNSPEHSALLKITSPLRKNSDDSNTNKSVQSLPRLTTASLDRRLSCETQRQQIFSFNGSLNNAGVAMYPAPETTQQPMVKKRKTQNVASNTAKSSWQALISDGPAKNKLNKKATKKMNNVQTDCIPPKLPPRTVSNFPMTFNPNAKKGLKRKREIVSDTLYITPMFIPRQHVFDRIFFNRQAFLNMCTKNVNLAHLTSTHIKKVGFVTTGCYEADTSVITFLDTHVSNLVYANLEFFVRYGLDVQSVRPVSGKYILNEHIYDTVGCDGDYSTKTLPETPGCSSPSCDDTTDDSSVNDFESTRDE